MYMAKPLVELVEEAGGAVERVEVEGGGGIEYRQRLSGEDG